MEQQHPEQRARLLPCHRQQPVEVESQQVGPLPHDQRPLAGKSPDQPWGPGLAASSCTRLMARSQNPPSQ